jgi:hypothetical protein
MEGRSGRFRRLWSAVRRRLPRLRGFDPPPDPRWPPFEPSLVPTGPPLRDPPAGAVALEPPSEPDPRVYPTETDAVGEPLPENDEDDAR